MDLFVSVAVFVVVVLSVLASYLYVLKVNEKKKADELAAWQKEQSKQRRRAAALRRNHPELTKVKPEPSSQDLVNQVMQSQLASKAGVWVDNYGRGDV